MQAKIRSTTVLGVRHTGEIAVGADGLFIETHPTPATALSDGANMLPLDQLEVLLQKLTRVRQAIRESGEVELSQLP